MLREVLQTAQNLSLDVVLGAVVSSMFVANYLSVVVPLPQLVALSIAVWLIYTADHLFDARKIPHTAHSERHRFHQQNFRTLLLIWTLVAIMGSVLLIYLPYDLTQSGLIMVGLVGVYFMLIRFLPYLSFLPKELMISVLYTGGIFLAPLYSYTDQWDSKLLILITQYTLLALVNVLLISWYEQDMDRKDRHHSFVLAVGSANGIRTTKICLLILYASIAIGIFLFYSSKPFTYVQLLLLLMTFTLQVVVLYPSFFSKKRRYRIWSDAVFNYPIFYLLLF